MNFSAEVLAGVEFLPECARVRMASGETLVVRYAEFPRLALANAMQRESIEVSPFGLHWPELDEDLSFRGLRKNPALDPVVHAAAAPGK